MINLRNALAGGGAILTIGAFILGAISGEQVRPVDNLVPSAPAQSICPSSWEDSSARDEHTIVSSCSRGDWLVILNPDGSFNYAWDGSSPEFVFDAEKVPGWR